MTQCSMCGAKLGDLGASCRDLFGEVLAREYEDLRYAAFHLLTVDAYALQHGEEHGPRSNAFHLARLCAQLERGAPSRLGNASGRAQGKRLEKLYRQLPRLEAPAARGDVTVSAVFEAESAEEHTERVQAWARSVWAAWADQHAWARAETLRWAAV